MWWNRDKTPDRFAVRGFVERAQLAIREDGEASLHHILPFRRRNLAINPAFLSDKPPPAIACAR
jgi:hypothetical protein